MASKRCSWKPASASTWTKPRTPTTTRRQRARRDSSAGCWRRRCRGDAAVATAAGSGWPWLDLKRRQVAFFLEPRLAVPGTLPPQQHVHQRTRLVGVVDRQLTQPAGDRKRVVVGKSVSLRVDLGGGRDVIKKRI